MGSGGEWGDKVRGHGLPMKLSGLSTAHDILTHLKEIPKSQLPGKE